MWATPIIGVLLTIGLVFLGVRSRQPGVRLVVILAALIVTSSLAYVFGTTWERLRNYDQFVYPFSLYSSHLRSLVEHQRMTELTNSIVLFDKAFGPRHDAGDLQDAVFRILKAGRYYEPTTNGARAPGPQRAFREKDSPTKGEKTTQ